jgi:hypothetical protein
MARLPGTIDMGGARGARYDGQGIEANRFDGLQDAAEAVDALGQAKAKRDDDAAVKILEAARPTFETRFSEEAAKYDGREPGFAAKSVAAFDDHFTPVAQDPTYSEGVRYALGRRLDAYKSDFGNRALGVEGRVRAGVVAEQRKVADAAELGGQVIGFNAKFSEKFQARVDGYDGSDPNFAAGVLADYDEEAKTALETAPERLKTDLQAALTARRVQVHANALEAQGKGHEAFVAKNADTTVAALANNVLSHPAAYDTTLASLDTAAAGVPKALRSEFIRQSKGAIAAARIEGLILKDDVGAAKAELDSGKYDDVLPPGTKQNLLARAEAAASGGPRSLEDWRHAYEADDALEAEVDARARGQSTGFSLQSIAGVFSPREVAAAERKLREADQVFAATGNLKAQSSSDLRARAAAPPPDASDPDFAAQSRAWELGRKAAAGELAEREKDPAAWAMSSQGQNDVGAQVQGALKGYLEADTGPKLRAAARTYAGYTLNWQTQAGIPPGAQRVFSKDQASDMVREYAAAPVDAKADKLAALTALWNALPTGFALRDGRQVNPKALAARELKAAGLAPADLSAMADLADEPQARIKLYAEAAADTAAHQALAAKGADASLQAALETRLGPFFASANAAPGSVEQNQARLSRARITARHLVLSKGLSARDAAAMATADLVDNYRFVDGWRIPVRVSASPGSVRAGAAKVLEDLIADHGALSYAAPSAAGTTEADARRKTADALQQRARWVTTEDDAGLQLMLPTERGWTLAPDKYGRPVRLSWDQLSGVVSSGPGYRRGQWMAPTPNAAAPPRADPARARNAFAAAIETRESHGDTRAVSPAGAVGVRQLLVGTARWQANMDKDPVFAGKSDAQAKAMLLADPALNRRLSDNHIAFLARRYSGNVGLIAAAYNAGPDHVDRWLRSIGDPRTGRLSLDEWVAEIPFEETRKYVRDVLPRALRNLRGR